jgi:hypothetical protein
VGIVDLGRGPDGKRLRQSYYCATRREVTDQLKAVAAKQQQGLSIRPDHQTVAEYLTTWIEGARSTVRESTWYRYSSLVRGHLLPHLGHRALSTLQPADCSVAFAGMAKSGLKPRTIIQARAVLGRRYGRQRSQDSSHATQHGSRDRPAWSTAKC